MAFLLVTGSCVLLCVTLQHSFSQWDPSKCGSSCCKVWELLVAALSLPSIPLCPLPMYLPSVSANEYHEKGIFAFSSRHKLDNFPLYHSEFPCNNPEEKLPICPFWPITPLRLVVLRLLHAHYFELMSFAAGGNLKEPVSGCQRQSMLGRYSWKSCAVKPQRNFSGVNFGHQYQLPMSLSCLHSFLSKHSSMQYNCHLEH